MQKSLAEERIKLSVFKYNFYSSVTLVPIFLPLVSPVLPTTNFHIQPSQPHLSLSMGLLYMFLDLTLPLLSPVIRLPCPSGHYQFVLNFHVSGYILLTCLFWWLGSTYLWDYMVLSFTTWLISLSMLLTSSIHAVTRVGVTSLILLHISPLCKCTTFFWSTHLLMGT